MFDPNSTIRQLILNSAPTFFENNIVLLEKRFFSQPWQVKILISLYQDLSNNPQLFGRTITLLANHRLNIRRLVEAFKISPDELPNTNNLLNENPKILSEELTINCKFNFSTDGLLNITISEPLSALELARQPRPSGARHFAYNDKKYLRSGGQSIIAAQATVSIDQQGGLTLTDKTIQRISRKKRVKEHKERKEHQNNQPLDFFNGPDGRMLVTETDLQWHPKAKTYVACEIIRCISVFQNSGNGLNCHPDIKLENIVFDFSRPNNGSHEAVTAHLVDLPRSTAIGRELEAYTPGHLPFDGDILNDPKKNAFSLGIILAELFMTSWRVEHKLLTFQNFLRNNTQIYVERPSSRRKIEERFLGLISKLTHTLTHQDKNNFSSADDHCCQLLALQLLMPASQRLGVEFVLKQYVCIYHIRLIMSYALERNDEDFLEEIQDSLEAVQSTYTERLVKAASQKTKLEFDFAEQFTDHLARSSGRNINHIKQCLANPEYYRGAIDKFVAGTRKLAYYSDNNLAENTHSSDLKQALVQSEEDFTSYLEKKNHSSAEHMKIFYTQRLANHLLETHYHDEKKRPLEHKMMPVQAQQSIPNQEQLIRFAQIFGDNQLEEAIPRYLDAESKEQKSQLLKQCPRLRYLQEPLRYLEKALKSFTFYTKLNAKHFSLRVKVVLLLDYAKMFDDIELINTLKAMSNIPQENFTGDNEQDINMLRGFCREKNDTWINLLINNIENPNKYLVRWKHLYHCVDLLKQCFTDEQQSADVKKKNKVQSLVNALEQCRSFSSIVEAVEVILRKTNQRAGNAVYKFVNFFGKQTQNNPKYSRVRYQALLCLLDILGFNCTHTIADINQFLNRFRQDGQPLDFFEGLDGNLEIGSLAKQKMLFTCDFYERLLAAMETLQLSQQLQLDNLELAHDNLDPSGSALTEPCGIPIFSN